MITNISAKAQTSQSAGKGFSKKEIKAKKRKLMIAELAIASKPPELDQLTPDESDFGWPAQGEPGYIFLNSEPVRKKHSVSISSLKSVLAEGWRLIKGGVHTMVFPLSPGDEPKQKAKGYHSGEPHLPKICSPLALLVANFIKSRCTAKSIALFTF